MHRYPVCCEFTSTVYWLVCTAARPSASRPRHYLLHTIFFALPRCTVCCEFTSSMYSMLWVYFYTAWCVLLHASQYVHYSASRPWHYCTWCTVSSSHCPDERYAVTLPLYYLVQSICCNLHRCPVCCEFTSILICAQYCCKLQRMYTVLQVDLDITWFTVFSAHCTDVQYSVN